MGACCGAPDADSIWSSRSSGCVPYACSVTAPGVDGDRSRERSPKVPIIAYTPNRNTYQSLSLYWGVIPRFLEISEDREEHIFEELDLAVQRDGFVAHGSTVVMVMGFPIKARTSVNLIKLHRLSERLPAD